MRTSRFGSIATSTALAALVSACAVEAPVAVKRYPAPVAVVPAPATTVVTVPASVPATVEYGRITNIEYFQAGAPTSSINVPGAIVGGLAGAVVGNAVSGGRDAATVLGGAAGAAIGSQINKPSAPGASVYRMTIQTDAGGWRTYDVPATGDLHIGDRVRIDNGVITRG